MDTAAGTMEREPGPVIGESGMFVVEIDGPTSDAEFGRVFADRIRPVLVDRHITTVLARDDEHNRAIYGFHHFDPIGIIVDAVRSADWTVRSARFFKGIDPVWLPPLPVFDCQMPHNSHQLQPGDRYRTCVGADRHPIAEWHNVDNCPVCGKVLQ